MKLSRIVLAAAVLAAAGSAHAGGGASGGGQGGHAHAKLDTNGDGAIDRSEAAARPGLAKRFDQLDVNHDGRIDASERPQHHGMGGEGEHGARLAKLDTDKDGRLSRAEAGNSRIAKHFDMIDSNHDGYLTREELRAAMERRRAQRMQEGSSTQNGAGSGRTGHH